MLDSRPAAAYYDEENRAIRQLTAEARKVQPLFIGRGEAIHRKKPQGKTVTEAALFTKYAGAPAPHEKRSITL